MLLIYPREQIMTFTKKRLADTTRIGAAELEEHDNRGIQAEDEFEEGERAGPRRSSRIPKPVVRSNEFVYDRITK